MPTAFAEPADVRKALQKVDLTGSIAEANVLPAIYAASSWFARQTNGHWYDSTGGQNDEVATSAASASGVRLDVPSSPHRQDRQLTQHIQGARYPVTHDGPYARVPLPHPYVQSLSALEVRDAAGDVEDWVAGSQTEGRGEDYFISTPGQASYGRSILRVRADQIGPRIDFGGLLTLDYDYGLDADTEDWQDVRRGIAALAGAEVMSDDQVIAQLPDEGNLVGVTTQYDNLVSAAKSYLNPYLSGMGVDR